MLLKAFVLQNCSPAGSSFSPQIRGSRNFSTLFRCTLYNLFNLHLNTIVCMKLKGCILKPVYFIREHCSFCMFVFKPAGIWCSMCRHENKRPLYVLWEREHPRDFFDVSIQQTNWAAARKFTVLKDVHDLGKL